MAKQRYNTSIDSLSYAKSEVPYVAPPTKEILALLDSRENRYLKSKTNIDLAKDLASSLPHNDISKDTYNDLVAGINGSIDGINKDNYADSELDTAQLIKDVKNKWGGKQLTEQFADFTSKTEAIAKAEKTRPEKKAWYADRLAKSLKPVTKQQDGTFTKGLAVMPNVLEEQDLVKDLDAVMAGWKADGLYTYDDNGTITADRTFLGKYGLTKTTGIKENDIMTAAFNMLSADKSKAEYIKDEADFELKDFTYTPENVLGLMSNVQLKATFPDKLPEAVTTQDIKELAGNSLEGLKAIAKNVKASNIKNTVASVLASKYGYEDVEKTFIDNVEEMEQLKARFAKKTGEGEGEELTPLGEYVTVMPSVTDVIVNPTSYDKFKEQEANGVSNYVTAKKEYDSLIAQYDKADNAGKVELKELLLQATQNLEFADRTIKDARTAQTNITNSVMELARAQNIDPKNNFTLSLRQEAVKEVKTTNIQNIANAGFSVPLNKFTVKAKPYDPSKSKTLRKNASGGNSLFPGNPVETININLPGYEGIDLPVYTEAAYEADKRLSTTIGAVKKNGKYEIMYPSANGKTLDKETSDFMTRLSNKIGYVGFKDLTGKLKKSNTSVNDIQDVPRLGDFQTAVAQLVVNEDADISAYPKSLQTKAKEVAKTIASKIDKSNIKVQQTLDYLYVDKEAKKGTAAKRMLDITQAIDENLISDGAQYKAYKQDGTLLDLPLFVKDLGITYTEEDIDFKNTKSSILLDNDPKHGQKIRLPIYLTEKGRNKVLNHNPKYLDASGTLNLTMVNSAGVNSAINKNIVDAVSRAYAESMGDKTPSGEAARSAYGLVKFNNSSEADRFYKLNLYTLPNGGKATHTLDNQEKLTINAIKRSATPGKLGDNDFYLTKPDGSIMVTDKQDNTYKFVPYAEYAKDVTGARYNRKLFDSPGDIASLIGNEYLSQQATKSNSVQAKNNQVQTSGSSYNITPTGVISDKHESNKNNTYKSYGKSSTPIKFKTANGNTVNLNSRVPARDLFDISNQIPGRYSNSMAPYFNVSVAGSAVKLINGYNLYTTSAFRDDDRNSKAGGKENSLHQYGKSFDASFDAGAEKLIADLKNNPQLAQDLGISMAFKEAKDGGYHLHVDFL